MQLTKDYSTDMVAKAAVTKPKCTIASFAQHAN
jgi:hypothetical protein